MTPSENEDGFMAPQIKCHGCGKFIAHSEMEKGGGARFIFVPDSQFGPEISEWECAACKRLDDFFCAKSCAI